MQMSSPYHLFLMLFTLCQWKGEERGGTHFLDVLLRIIETGSGSPWFFAYNGLNGF